LRKAVKISATVPVGFSAMHSTPVTAENNGNR
jgi:hypothetical protein